MGTHEAAALFLALASCWRGTATEPVEITPAPVAAAKPAAGTTRPNTGPRLSRQSPGPLTRGHEAWDNDAGCLQCHVVVGGKAPLANARCLGCHDHDEITRRIAMNQGFHASKYVTGKPCERCHHEHKGRGYNNLGWQGIPGGKATFDHALTGWPLDAVYIQMRCEQCHTRTNMGGLPLYLGLDRGQFP